MNFNWIEASRTLLLLTENLGFCV